MPRVKEYYFYIIIAIVGFIGAWQYLNINQQNQFYFQFHFEPAVLKTCGYPFARIIPKQPEALYNFLHGKSQHFDCKELPKKFNVNKNVAVNAWYYMVYSVVQIWKIMGISWSAVNIIIALLLSISLMLAFALYRKVMNPYYALIGVIAFASLPPFYHQLLNFRDFGKIPFFLATFLILTHMITSKELTWKKLLFLSLLLGVVIGIGYGFRHDIYITIPFVIVTFLFLLPIYGKVSIIRNILMLMISLVILFALSLPLASKSAKIGSCFWHVPVVSQSHVVGTHLNIKPAIFNVGYTYLDEYAYVLASAKAKHYIVPCSLAYDRITRDMYLNYFKTFPANFIVRAYKSIILILRPYGLILIGIALIWLVTIDLRYAISALLFVLYFFGYPSVYFIPRHYAYLYFWFWLPIGAIFSFFTLKYQNKEKIIMADFRQIRTTIKKIILFFAVTFILLSLLLWVTRFWQINNVKKIITAYQKTKSKQLKYQLNYTDITGHNISNLRQTDHIKQSANLIFKWPNDLIKVNPSHNITPQVNYKILKVVIDNKLCQHQKIPIALKYYTNKYWYQFSVALMPLYPDEKYTYYFPVFFIRGDLTPAGVDTKENNQNTLVYPQSLFIAKSNLHCLKSVNTILTKNLPYPFYWIQVPETLHSNYYYEKL